MEIKYSIVMPCLMRKEEHKEVVNNCIGSVKSNSENYEFIMVNDGSPLKYKGFNEADTLIIHKKPMGIAPSWNDGIKVSRGKYVVVINDDIGARPGWLEAMVEALDKVPNSVVSSVMVEHLPGYTGICERREWFPGSCFMLTQKAIKKVGLFDEQFTPFYYEDVDYWTRVYKKGFVVARNHNLQIQHKESDVLHKIENNGEIFNKNKEKYLKKWGFDPIPVLYNGEEKFPWEK